MPAVALLARQLFREAGARDYAFHARHRARADAVASGVSDRQAAKATRAAAARGSSVVTRGRRLRRIRQRVVDGQLGANWVDVFGPVVTLAHGHSQWPERMDVDSVGFRSGGTVAGQCSSLRKSNPQAEHTSARPSSPNVPG